MGSIGRIPWRTTVNCVRHVTSPGGWGPRRSPGVARDRVERGHARWPTARDNEQGGALGTIVGQLLRPSAGPDAVAPGLSERARAPTHMQPPPARARTRHGAALAGMFGEGRAARGRTQGKKVREHHFFYRYLVAGSVPSLVLCRGMGSIQEKSARTTGCRGAGGEGPQKKTGKEVTFFLSFAGGRFRARRWCCFVARQSDTGKSVRKPSCRPPVEEQAARGCKRERGKEVTFSTLCTGCAGVRETQEETCLETVVPTGC